MSRYVILAIGSFDYIENKTGNMLIRYQHDQVLAVIDPYKEGKIAEEVLGWGGNIPCVKTFIDTKRFSPTHLVVGNAPQGGFLDKKSKSEIHDAIKNGCDIISGMHSFLNDDPELVKEAIKNNINLIDLRKPGHPPKFPKGSWKKRAFPVLLIVGSDCDTGKMTTAWEITKALKIRNKRVHFIGTGQTGILLSGSGVPLDAVIADFMVGEVEYCLDQLPENTELAIVEGQGALNNMHYSGVTLGLMHGCMPDYLIFWGKMKLFGENILFGKPISNYLQDQLLSRWYKMLLMYGYSTPYLKVNDFPAEMAFETLTKMNLFTYWNRIPGGVYRYVEAILDRFRGKVQCDVKIDNIVRKSNEVSVNLKSGENLKYDKIIFATPPDQILEILADPTDDEKKRFFEWKGNHISTKIHTDIELYKKYGIKSYNEFDVFEGKDGKEAGYNVIDKLVLSKK